MQFIHIIFVLNLFLPHILKAQNNINGFVYDNENNPIPYTSIYDSLRGKGTYSDINGHFMYKVEKLPVSLWFSNVGYESKREKITEAKNFKIKLEDKIIVLNEVLVQASQLKPTYIGSPKKRKGVTTFHVLDPFDQYGIIINNYNNILYKFPKLISLSIKVGSWQFLGVLDGVKPTGNKQLRLRMYNLDEDKIVGDDILHEDVYLSPSKKGWYTINIEDKSINLPTKGFVIALEWLENNPKFFYVTKNADDGKKYNERQYGISISGHKLSAKEKRFYQTVRLFNGLGKRWEKERVFKDYIPCIRLEIIDLDDNSR